MAASDFIDHWIDLLDTHAAAGQHQQVVDLAGEVMNRYPVERNPGNVSWAFSRLVAAWAAIGGREATESASAAISHMDARLTRCRWKRAARAPMPWRTLAPTMPGCSSPAWRRWTNMTVPMRARTRSAGAPLDAGRRRVAMQPVRPDLA
jgi:hypothetical protein